MKKLILRLASGLISMSLMMAAIISAEEMQKQEEQTLPAGSKKLTVEQHLAVKQKRVDESSEGNERGELITNGMYLTTHPMASHGLYKTTLSGDKVELNDGSVWNVWYAYDGAVVNRWLEMRDQVIICPASFFDPTDYLLVSQRTGEEVPVNLIEMEVLSFDPTFRGQRLWIYSLDYIYDSACGCFYYSICLNDGSLWDVDSHDSYLCSSMNPGDVVIVGVDEKVSAPTYNILVHFNSLEYIHADCLNR